MHPANAIPSPPSDTNQQRVTPTFRRRLMRWGWRDSCSLAQFTSPVTAGNRSAETGDQAKSVYTVQSTRRPERSPVPLALGQHRTDFGGGNCDVVVGISLHEQERERADPAYDRIEVVRREVGVEVVRPHRRSGRRVGDRRLLDVGHEGGQAAPGNRLRDEPRRRQRRERIHSARLSCIAKGRRPSCMSVAAKVLRWPEPEPE
jgi:hypothetical protein